MSTRNDRDEGVRARKPQGNRTATAAALARLGVREYAVAEMEQYLRRRGYEAPQIAEALAALIKNRYIDDQRYAKMVVRHQAARGKGPGYIRMALRKKGVVLAPSQLREILLEVTGKAELEVARELVERRYPNARRDRALAAKAIQALLRRGFSYDVAMQAVRGGAAR